ncbi:MAG: hypothetical protein HQ500_11105 [Flavobacteriales bacterium]|nr:hypothetical protein [Flavobacteriales bacterium]
MKRLLLGLTVVLGISLVSCEKCRECACESTTEYYFEDGFDAGIESSIRDAYDKEFDEDYPAFSEELCESRGKFDDAKAEFESKSTVISDGDAVQGYDWSVDFSRSCSCED